MSKISELISHKWNAENINLYWKEIETIIKNNETLRSEWSQKCYEEPSTHEDDCYGCVYIYMRCKTSLNLEIFPKSLNDKSTYDHTNDQFFKCYCNNIKEEHIKKKKQTLNCICYEPYFHDTSKNNIPSNEQHYCKGLNTRKCTFNKKAYVDITKPKYTCTINDGTALISSMQSKINCPENLYSRSSDIAEGPLISKSLQEPNACLVMYFETTAMKINILFIVIPLLFTVLVLIDRYIFMKKKQKKHSNKNVKYKKRTKKDIDLKF